MIAGITAAFPAACRGGAGRALDIGAGVGRHSRLLAQNGFDVTATDLSKSGIAEVDELARREALPISTQIAAMTELPFEDDSFDYVLAFNVIYHGDGPIVDKAIAEILRVLKPGGLYQGTMLSKRNGNFGIGDEIALNTFVRDGDDDKNHPHSYCNAAELIALIAPMELLSLEDRLHSKPGSWHWHLLSENEGSTK